MKKFVKIVLTIAFVVASAWTIYRLVVSFNADKLIFTVIAFVLFLMHLFAWIAPRTFLNLCWKVTALLPDRWDYDTAYRNL